MCSHGTNITGQRSGHWSEQDQNKILGQRSTCLHETGRTGSTKQIKGQRST